MKKIFATALAVSMIALFAGCSKQDNSERKVIIYSNADDEAVATAVKNAGFDPYEQKLLGITAMTSLLGKKKFEEVLGGLIEKPQGKPTLVPDSDKRPSINTAQDDFKEN